MDRPRTPRRRFEASSLAPSTITECARRYHAAALALATSLGLPLTADFLQAYHAAISCVYIEAGRTGARLSTAIKLPPLAPAGNPALEPEPDREPLLAGEGTAPVVSTNGQGERTDLTSPKNQEKSSTAEAPLTIPAHFPSAGVRITDVKPGVLPMLISKTAALVHAEGAAWVPLLGALQAERAQRLARGQRRDREGRQG